MTETKVLAMRHASAYIDAVGEDRPIIFLASSPQLIPTLRQVYAGIPPAAITRTRVFVGTLQDLRAGRPTTVSGLAAASRRSLSGAREVLDDDPLILYLDEFNPRLPAPLDAEQVAPGVSALAGRPISVTASLPNVDAWSLATTTAGGLLLLWIIGLGWSWWLVPTWWLGRLAIAPALGTALLALAGTMGDTVGLRFGFVGSVSLVASLSVAGWIPTAWRSARRRWRGGRHAPSSRSVEPAEEDSTSGVSPAG
jgi:hypothetical protein